MRTPTHLYGIQLEKDRHGITDEQVAFFDVRQDPYEIDNLVGTGRQVEVAGELRQRVVEWHRRTPWLSAGQ